MREKEEGRKRCEGKKSELVVTSRGRHTRWNLVTEVQTCALPIFSTSSLTSRNITAPRLNNELNGCAMFLDISLSQCQRAAEFVEYNIAYFLRALTYAVSVYSHIITHFSDSQRYMCRF